MADYKQFHIIQPKLLEGKHCYHSRFIDEETEAWRGEVPGCTLVRSMPRELLVVHPPGLQRLTPASPREGTFSGWWRAAGPPQL